VTFLAQENGATIDAGGTLDGKDFQGGDGLGQAIHDSPQASRCLVDKMYRSAVGRKATADEHPYMDFLNQTFQANGYRVPDLMRAIAVSRSFYAISMPSVGVNTLQHAAVHTSNGDRS
jgi:hypothetical protein